MNILVVLLWKHLIARRKRWFQTILEILLTALLLIFVFLLRNLLNPQLDSLSAAETNVHHTDPLSMDYLIKTEHQSLKVLYTPPNTFTDRIMDKVAKKLQLDKVEYLPHVFQRLNKGFVFSFTNESMVTNYSNKIDSDKNLAIVIFKVPDDEKIPEKLNYTIRMKNDFRTSVYSADESSGPHSEFGRQYEPFVMLQWAIDTSYIEERLGKDIDLRVQLQEFPYQQANSNSLMDFLCSLLAYCCLVAPTLCFVMLFVRLVGEKASGIRELMRMMGVKAWAYGIAHFINTLPGGLAYIVLATILFTVSSNPLLRHTDPSLIFFMTTLHFISLISVAFACSYIINKAQYANTVALFIATAFFMVSRYLNNFSNKNLVMFLEGLCPHVPVHWFFNNVAAVEKFGRGLRWSGLFEQYVAKSGSVAFCFLMTIVQGVLFFSLAWFLDHVKPGPYGIAMPWTFLCMKQYWRPKKKVTPDSESDETEMTDVQDQQYFESTSSDMEVGIKIVDVSKYFGDFRALNHVNLDIFKGEITVLLGHNGAGKTTLMSIITGMYSASEGNVYVNGLDSVLQQSQVRKQLGFCPQHNMFFDELTVVQHVMFFSMLKGSTLKEARQSSEDLLEELNILDKKGVLASELSGGMKRRLQLACALAGNARVLILDEPTSGLDVETRRELWDILLSLRGSRTVLLSTHFMEEADALGDRVAALHHGTLKCHATPMYLKKAIGTGYRLSFTTVGIPNEKAISNVVTKHVPDASLKEQSLNSLSYNLPARSSNKFRELFSDLENNKDALGIGSIGIGVSTLEDVFLRLCSNVDTVFSDDEVDGANMHHLKPTISGPPLCWRQFCVLVKRQCRFLWSRKWAFLTLQVLLPILSIICITYCLNNDDTSQERNPKMMSNLDVFRTIPERRVLYSVNTTGANVNALRMKMPQVIFEDANGDVASAVLRAGKTDILEYNKYLVGVELNESDAKVLYTTTVRHAAPVAMNVFSNLLASKYLEDADGDTIYTVNHPIEGAYVTRNEIKKPKEEVILITYAVFLSLIFFSTIINVLYLVCKERAVGSRHIHIMVGCPAWLYWLTTLLTHTVIVLLTLGLPIIICALTLDRDYTIDHSDYIVAVFVVVLLGTLSFCSLTYLICFKLGEKGAGSLLIGIIFLFGLLTPFASEFKEALDSPPWYLTILHYISHVMPPHLTSLAFMRMGNLANRNALCDLNKHFCASIGIIPAPVEGFDSVKCCSSSKPLRCYFCTEKGAPYVEMIAMTALFVVFMTLVILIEMGFMQMIFRIIDKSFVPVPPRFNDKMASAEKEYVRTAIKQPKQNIRDAMLVHDVHKIYRKLLCWKSFKAVKGINFAVKKGECFGLLGVNGAGKSTTFKMLTAEVSATRGTIFANGYFLKPMQGEYLGSLGYCPQFFGLDEFQTGRHNLELLLTLRGLSAEDVQQETTAWIQIVGLEKYMNRPVSSYSGGCVRRMACAAALCVDAPVTLLDEPTAGVDVSARRRVWAAIRRALLEGRAVVITSHSMDEMEALCGRIAIMCAGEICALGSPAELRANHATGHSVVFKLTNQQSDAESVNKLKDAMHNKFKCTLKDEHKTMLHFHINETLPYSQLFQKMEDLKNSFPGLIEDFSVTETTLEEVFLSFAKFANTEDVAKV